LRESLNILENEGVPIVFPVVETSSNSEEGPKKNKIALCKVCHDTAAIRTAFPDKMRKYFRREQNFKGFINKEDWLCKSCYGDWYRDNREWIKQQELGIKDETPEEDDGPIESDSKEEESRLPKKEYYIKTRIYLLFLVVKKKPISKGNWSS